MRASFPALVVAVTFVAGACSQTTSPTSPSSVGATASALAASMAPPDRITGAAAKPQPPSTTVLLVCDSAVNAQVDFRLVDDLVNQTALTPLMHLACGPDSPLGSRRDTLKVTSFAKAGFALVDVFTVQSGGFNGGCPGGTVVPGSMECPGSSKKAPAPGATLTFK